MGTERAVDRLQSPVTFQAMFPLLHCASASPLLHLGPELGDPQHEANTLAELPGWEARWGLCPATLPGRLGGRDIPGPWQIGIGFAGSAQGAWTPGGLMRC